MTEGVLPRAVSPAQRILHAFFALAHSEELSSAGDIFNRVAQLFNDTAYVLDVHGQYLGMFVGWFYYRVGSDATLPIWPETTAEQRSLSIPVLDQIDGKWCRAEGEATANNYFLGRDTPLPPFLDLFKDARRTALERARNIVFCEDGEVLWYLLDWRFRTHLHDKGTGLGGSSGDELTAGASAVEEAAAELGLLCRGLPTARATRLWNWLKKTTTPDWLIMEGCEDVREIASASSASAETLRQVAAVLRNQTRTATDVVSRARFNVPGHYVIRNCDGGRDKSIVYFPLCITERQEDPEVVFVGTFVGLTPPDEGTGPQEMERIDAVLERAVPYVTTLGLPLVGELRRREAIRAEEAKEYAGAWARVALHQRHGISRPLDAAAEAASLLLRSCGGGGAVGPPGGWAGFRQTLSAVCERLLASREENLAIERVMRDLGTAVADGRAARGASPTVAVLDFVGGRIRSRLPGGEVRLVSEDRTWPVHEGRLGYCIDRIAENVPRFCDPADGIRLSCCVTGPACVVVIEHSMWTPEEVDRVTQRLRDAIRGAVGTGGLFLANLVLKRLLGSHDGLAARALPAGTMGAIRGDSQRVVVRFELSMPPMGVREAT